MTLKANYVGYQETHIPGKYLVLVNVDKPGAPGTTVVYDSRLHDLSTDDLHRMKSDALKLRGKNGVLKNESE